MSMIQVQSNVTFDSSAHVLHYGDKSLPVDYTHFGNVETIRTQPLAGVVKRMAKAMGITKLGYPVVMLQGLKGITMDHFIAIDAELPAGDEYTFKQGVLYYTRPGTDKLYKVREYWATDRTKLAIVK